MSVKKTHFVSKNGFSGANGITSEELKLFVVPVAISVLLFVVGQVMRPGFASISNIGNILAIASILGFASMGQTLVIVSGGEGIDLSVGQLMSMGAVIGCVYLNGMNGNIALTILILVIFGAVIGLIDALGIVWVGIPPLVMTLAIGTLAGGFTLAFTRGEPQGSVPSILLALGGSGIGAFFKWLFVLEIIAIVIVEFVLRKSKYGKALYLTGNNRNAARLCGIKTARIIVMTYVIAGIIGTLSGLMLLSFIGSAQLEMGNDYTMLSIAAVVIGGTQLAGGKGTYVGSFLGAIVLIVLTSVLISIGIPSGMRETITGIVLVLILLVYSRQPSIRQ